MIASQRIGQFVLICDEWHVFIELPDHVMHETPAAWIQPRDWWESKEARLRQVFVQAEHLVNDI